MTLVRIALLLLATFAANAHAVGDTQSPPNLIEANRSHMLTNSIDSRVSTNGGVEERGITDAVEKFKGLFRKNPSGPVKLGSMNKNADVTAAVKKMPIVKKLETAVEKDPNFMTKLSKDPDAIQKLSKNPAVGKVSAMLEKNNVKIKITEENMSKLRSAAGKDPVKLSAVRFLDRLGGMLTFAGAAGLVIIVLALAGWAIIPIIFQHD